MTLPMYDIRRLTVVKYKHEHGDPVFDLFHYYLDARNKFQKADYELITLKQRVQILEAENNFMLRLINERIAPE
jgi:hypothetical protein